LRRSCKSSGDMEMDGKLLFSHAVCGSQTFLQTACRPSCTHLTSATTISSHNERQHEAYTPYLLRCCKFSHYLAGFWVPVELCSNPEESPCRNQHVGQISISSLLYLLVYPFTFVGGAEHVDIQTYLHVCCPGSGEKPSRKSWNSQDI
jgi:hypothetical protein